jgi:hypothetical protein
MSLAASLVNPEPIARVLYQLWISVGVSAANYEYGFLIEKYPEILQQKAFGFNSFWRGLMQEFFDLFAARKVSSITNTERQRINRLLQEAADQGMDVYATAQTLTSDDIDTYRSRLIARTEILGASSHGARLAINQTGLQMNKVWLSARRFSTRILPRDQFDHYHMDNVSVSMNDQFLVISRAGGEFMDYPGDPKGSAGNICNCLCQVIYEPVRDQSGRLIRVNSALPNLAI